MEYFDIVDKVGNPTGETVERSVAHANGIRHRTAHIWVIRRGEDGTEILLQKRALNKDSFPGLLDTSSAGHIQAGDEPLESALRELSEELDIHAKPEDLTYIGNFDIDYSMVFHGKPFNDNEISFVFMYDKPVDISTLNIQKEELESVSWYSLEETVARVKQHHPDYCVPIEGLMTLYNYLGGHAE